MISKVEELSKMGYGISWNPVQEMYWPFCAEGDGLMWWHDPEDIATESFTKSVEKLYDKVTGDKFEEHLEFASKEVAKWPKWMQNLLG